MKVKFFKKIFGVLVFCLIAGIICFSSDLVDVEKLRVYFTVAEFTEDFDNNNLPFSTHNYDMLSDIEKQAYVAIFKNISKHPEYIKIPSLTSDEFNKVYFAVKNDNPDIMCFSDTCSMFVFGSASFLQFTYEYDIYECKQRSEKLQETVKIIIDEMPEFPDDYSRELYIHDYIVQNCDYRDEQNASSAYSCLVDGVAVCSGYSRAAMLLFKNAGIDSMLVAGVGESASQGTVSHMWNIVWIDGYPYHVDVTWDDPANNTGEIISHLYFNLTDDELNTDHSEYDIPFECNVETYNYFNYNNLMYNCYNKDVLNILKLKLVNNINNGQNFIEFAFDNKGAYLSAKHNLVENITANSDIYGFFEYLMQYTDGNVDNTHVNFACDDNKNYIRMMFDNIE